MPPLRVRMRRLARRVRSTLWNDKVAVSHTVFFLVAAALFLPIMGGLFLFLQDTADGMEKPSAGLRTRAVQGLSQITQSSGVAVKSGEPTTSVWEKHIDGLRGYDLAEIGLLDENVTALSYSKIDNLQRGGLIQNTTDEYVNYPEFKDALSLGNKYDFHVRLYPIVHTGTTDPYGTGPVASTHVAYVASLDNGDIETVGSNTGQWLGLSHQAQAEIQALKDIKLGGANVNEGFDGKAYQPINHVAVHNPSGYTSLVVRDGDVIGDTSMTYEVLGGTSKPYWQWFVQDYLFFADGSNRYDVLVFGTGTDLNRWDDPIAKAAFTTYVAQGGSMIFLDNRNLPANFVTDCVDASCLLYQQGSGAPVSTPDVTNQMLSTPNALDWRQWASAATSTWDVCNNLPPPPTVGPGVDERKGWLPIVIDGTTDPCAMSYFGATSSDRFGPTGGTVIVDSWNMTGTDLPKYLANVISFAAMRSAFLDYGPEIPKHEAVESAERLMLLQLPSGQYIDVKLVFYLWKNDCTATWDSVRGDRCSG